MATWQYFMELIFVNLFFPLHVHVYFVLTVHNFHYTVYAYKTCPKNPCTCKIKLEQIAPISYKYLSFSPKDRCLHGYVNTDVIGCNMSIHFRDTRSYALRTMLQMGDFVAILYI